ncbi:aromatic amino acid lyase [Paracoccus sp. p4-l81]|uniref:aromatic amino acid lyase n=1 Tax=Paracoccus sp. p4-l81 TaxID=3342806 RepID=UPI0035BB0394
MTPTPIKLNGSPLALCDLARIAAGPVRVTIDPAAMARMTAGRAAFQAALAGGQAIYGSTTGVGAMKDTEHDGADLTTFSAALPHAHQIAVGEDMPDGIARLTLALRLNTLLTGQVGTTPELAQMLAALLNHDCLPVLLRRGSAGCADLGQMGQVATVLTGEGQVRMGGETLPAGVALARCGLRPHPMPPRDGLAAVGTNSFGLAKSAAQVLRAGRLLRQAMAQAVLGAQAMGLDRDVWWAAARSGHRSERDLAGWFLMAAEAATDWPAVGRVHDPLSGRMLVQVFAGAATAMAEAAQAVIDETAQVDDNPMVIDGRVVTSGGSLLMGLSLRMSALKVAMAHLGRNVFNRCLLLTNGGLEGLTVNLVPPGTVATGYGPVMKLALEQSVRMTAAAMPISVLNQTVAAGLEDEAAFISLSAGRLGEQLDALHWLLAVEAMLATQALDLRALRAAPGVAALVHGRVRAHIPPLTADRPQSGPLMALAGALADADFVSAHVAAAPFPGFDRMLGLAPVDNDRPDCPQPFHQQEIPA